MKNFLRDLLHNPRFCSLTQKGGLKERSVYEIHKRCRENLPDDVRPSKDEGYARGLIQKTEILYNYRLAALNNAFLLSRGENST